MSQLDVAMSYCPCYSEENLEEEGHTFLELRGDNYRIRINILISVRDHFNQKTTTLVLVLR